MRLGILATTSLALPAAAADKQATRHSSRQSTRNRGRDSLIQQVLGDIRSRMLENDGVVAGAQQDVPLHDRRHGRELWKSLPVTRRNQQLSQGARSSYYDYNHHVEPDVGILSHRFLDQDTIPDAGTVDEYMNYKFCDMFLQLGVFDNMVCDCQNNPRARVQCQSPKQCYQSIDPAVCLSTRVEMIPRPDNAVLNLQVCYSLIEPKQADYCFTTDMDYESFFVGNETLYESCSLSVDGETCNSCEITSQSQNDLECTGLSSFDCSNTAAGSVSTSDCSTFYNPFPEVTRIADIESDGGGGWRSRSRLVLSSTVIMGAVLAWGSSWL